MNAAWIGVLGAIVGALIGVLGSFLVARYQHSKSHEDNIEDRRATQRREEILERAKGSEAAIETLTDVYGVLHKIDSLIRTEKKQYQPLIDNIHQEWAGVRKRLIMLRQIHPEPYVRHAAERLQEQMDESVDSHDMQSDRGRQMWYERRMAAREGANELAKKLRSDRIDVDPYYVGSEAAPPSVSK